MTHEQIFNQIQGGLIVSCQALEHEPLYTKEGGVMPLMAKAAAQSGAVGIRANTVRDITQIKQVVDLPVIGIIKKDYPGTPMYITVTMQEVDELVACGVDILAVQGTGALRPNGQTSAEFIRAIKEKYPDQLVMADCDNIENALACAGDASFLYDVALFSKAILLQMNRQFKPDMSLSNRKQTLSSIRTTWLDVKRAMPRGSSAIEFITYEKRGEIYIGALDVWQSR